MRPDSSPKFRFPTTVLVLACWFGLAAPGGAVDIRFDYSRDHLGFFASGTEARRVLESAEAFYESVLQDSLGSLMPSTPNALTVDFLDPRSQSLVEIVPPAIPADVVLIYVGATNLPGSVIGSSWQGGIYPYGTLSWLNYVDTRGQIGIVYGLGANEVAPWGGSITVDTHDGSGYPRQWDYSLGVQPSESGLHFYSLLVHEMAHVLGFGISDSWWQRVNGYGQFTGSHAVAVNGGAVALDSGNNHWKQGTASTVFGTSEVQGTSMDPVLIQDSPSYATALDMAALADLGWELGSPPAAPEVPVLATALSPTSRSLVLSWPGSPECRYTLLVTSDFTRWRASGVAMPGSAGTMQVSLPMDGSAIAFRLLVENTFSATAAKAGAIAHAKEALVEEGELTARARTGGGALMRLVEDGGSSHQGCEHCRHAQASPLDAILRADWAGE